MRLTEPQKRALRHLAKFPEQWRKDTPVRQRCLNVLNEKGLVRVAFEPEKGFIEMITPAGLDEIAKENEDRIMKSHFEKTYKITACGRRLTYYPIDGGRPTLRRYSDWKLVDCLQCLAARQSQGGNDTDNRGQINETSGPD